MNEQPQYKFERTGDREISVIIRGIMVPIARDINWQWSEVISNHVLDLDGASFEIFRDTLIEHKLVVEGFTKICQGSYGSPGRFPAERISYDEFVELTKFGLLTDAETKDYFRYIDRQENAPEKDSHETDALTRIYLIRDNATGLVKIGQSHNPARRLKALVDQATLLPTANEFVLIHTWEAAGIIERQLHERFADKRIRGEWFQLTQADIDELIALST